MIAKFYSVRDNTIVGDILSYGSMAFIFFLFGIVVPYLARFLATAWSILVYG